jgi:hypothetical protein
MDFIKLARRTREGQEKEWWHNVPTLTFNRANFVLLEVAHRPATMLKPHRFNDIRFAF